jgi:hypothetical protein
MTSWQEGFDPSAAFAAAYQREFGFVLDRPVVVDDVRVRATGRAADLPSIQVGALQLVRKLSRLAANGWLMAAMHLGISTASCCIQIALHRQGSKLHVGNGTSCFFVVQLKCMSDASKMRILA